MKRHRCIGMLVFIVLFFSEGTMAQQWHFDVFDRSLQDVRGDLSVQGKSRFAAILPMNVNEAVYDSTLLLHDKLSQNAKMFGFVLLNRNVLIVGKGKYHLMLDPVVDVWAGAGDSKLRAFGGGALGLQMKAVLGKQVSLGGYGRINQASFPAYITDYIRKYRVVPGMGYAQRSTMGGYFFWDWDVYANYHFLDYFDLEAGMGRNFWGDGYRTFFLSDEAFSYPYIKLTTSVWKIKYINLYTAMKDMRSTGSSMWDEMQTKYGSFHFLSWDVSKRVNLGFFEAIIWQKEDSAANRGFDVNYINPFIFYRPVEYSIGSPDNCLMGISLKVNAWKKNFFYGQYLMDDIIVSETATGLLNRIKHAIHPEDSSLKYGYWTNKQAWQLGFNAYDLFKIKDLDLQVEYNAARPYTFSHLHVISNYSHYNQPLAHPAGSNFHEILGFIRYKTGRWFFEWEGSYLLTGLDTAGTHYGQDIFQSTFDSYHPEIGNIVVPQYYNNIGQGIRSEVWYSAIRATWLLNFRLNFRAEASVGWRQVVPDPAKRSGLFATVGIKTSWYNPRWDR